MSRPVLQPVFALISEERRRALEAAGLLILRVGVGGGMLFGHGLGKLLDYGAKSELFPDPLGIGAPLSMALAIFAEALCAALVVAGACTRLAVVPLLMTMAVAFLLVHAGDPWSRKELAFMYFVPFATLLLTGPGPWSVDGLLRARFADGEQPRERSA